MHTQVEGDGKVCIGKEDGECARRSVSACTTHE